MSHIKKIHSKDADNFIKTVNRNEPVKLSSAAKLDLMKLGIELDDNLIQRLQKNLGIETIFQVANKSSELIKNKPKVPIGSVPEMAYRNVTESDHSKGKDSINKPFQRESSFTDNKLSMSILHELNNSQSRVESRYRPALDKMIETFRLAFIRSPERFIGTLLGRTIKPNGSKSNGTSLSGGTANFNPSESISRLVLKSRFIQEEDFIVMIKRVDGSYPEDLIKALFRLLAVEKSFTSAKRRDIIDLWEFLTLLKTAAEESRRSFDCKTSRLATDVEFWRRSNFNLSFNSDGNSAAENVRENERFQAERTNKLHNMTINTHRVCNDNSSSNGDSKGSRRDQSRTQRNDEMMGHKLSVAQLLGNDDSIQDKIRKHFSNTDGVTAKSPKSPMGTFRRETHNVCDVPMALNNAYRKPSSVASSRKTLNSSQGAGREEGLRGNYNPTEYYNVFGATQVGDLITQQTAASTAVPNTALRGIPSSTQQLQSDTGTGTGGDSEGGVAAVRPPPLVVSDDSALPRGSSNSDAPRDSKPRARSAYPERPSARSANTLQNEFKNKTTVAFALGDTRDIPSVTPSPNKSREFSRSYLQSESNLIRKPLNSNELQESVAASLGSSRVDSKGRNNITGHNNNNASAGAMHKMRFDLHRSSTAIW